MIKKTGVIMCFVISLALIAFLIYSLAFHRSGKIVSVNESQKITYQVFQIDNLYIESPYLGMGENYLHSYTDYVKLNNEYECHMSANEHLEYSYDVVAHLVARYRKNPNSLDNPTILEKPYTLDTETSTVRRNTLALSRSYDLRLEEYKKELDDFAATIDLPVSSEVRVDFVVTLKGTNGIDSSFTRSLTIPVNTEFYNIGLSGDETRTNDFNVPARNLPLPVDMTLAVLGVGFFVLGLILFKRIPHNKSSYRLEVDGYLKMYADMIIDTTSSPNLNKYENIQIKNFKEMLNLAKRMALPIMYVEDEKSALFYILNSDVIHLFRVCEPE